MKLFLRVSHFFWQEMLAVAGLVGVDQLTKFLASAQITYNSDISFGFELGSPQVVIALNSMILLALVGLRLTHWWSVTVHRGHTVWWLLLVAGGSANLLDRLVWGGVRDWLPVPGLGLVNNLADWYITLAVITLLGMMVWQTQK